MRVSGSQACLEGQVSSELGHRGLGATTICADAGRPLSPLGWMSLPGV